MSEFPEHSPNPDLKATTVSSVYHFRFKDVLQGLWPRYGNGAQMLFVAFGALVLVPILAGVNPNVALFTSGVGTLCFQLVTGGKIPVYLASSFAFIAPITLSVQKYGLPATLSGLAAAGIVYLILSLIIFWRGSGMVTRILPPIVTGPVIMVIGLSLASTAVKSDAARSWGGSAVLGVSPMSDCRGFPHERLHQDRDWTF
ncbi:solute carrier family 23 protein [Moorena sp. SIOASIH]|uniref:solute carrier family 23 protein n=1 Tax=Moorena sp. SIOASIH TaxID=2607817 RepID=UPI0025EC5016|nr:solute carrier family 23 protein [Moorena sp. SIOASIH]